VYFVYPRNLTLSAGLLTMRGISGRLDFVRSRCDGVLLHCGTLKSDDVL
jgi:hypothetical protein